MKKPMRTRSERIEIQLTASKKKQLKALAKKKKISVSKLVLTKQF